MEEKEDKIEQLLGPRARNRLRKRLGEKGERRLLERWGVLKKREGFRLKGHYTLGLQGAVLRVEKEGVDGVLKICTLDNIFCGQDAALQGAVGAVPRIIKRFPEEEAWFMEEILGFPGKSGSFSFLSGTDILSSFHQGEILKGLYPLLSYYFTIARYSDCEEVLERKEDILLLTRDLPSSLVHGDPTPENIILINGGAKTLIDPTGFFGDPAFDFAVLALSSKDPLLSLERATSFYPAWRIYLWSWLRAELSAAHSLHEGEKSMARPLLEIKPILKERFDQFCKSSDHDDASLKIEK